MRYNVIILRHLVFILFICLIWIVWSVYLRCLIGIFYLSLYLVAHVNFLLNEYDDDDDDDDDDGYLYTNKNTVVRGPDLPINNANRVFSDSIVTLS